MSLINSEIFSYEKMLNLANSSFNDYVLNIKVAQNTKQFRRLVLENFITVINFLIGRKGFYGLRPWVFGLLNIPPLCQQATSIRCVNYGSTYTCKCFCWHVWGDDILKKMFSDFNICNVKLIVLTKILHL